MAVSTKRASELKEALNAFLSRARPEARIPFDPVELPRRYTDPRDIEVSGLLSASLAYGRADLFKPKLEQLHAAMGPSPAAFVRSLDVAGAARVLKGFVYRFNVGTDLAVLLLGMGKALNEEGSLEQRFVQGLRRGSSLHEGLAAFTRSLRQVPMARLRAALGPERGLDHLLPCPLGEGAAKRLHLFLRWMVRGPDAVDFGIWRSVSPAELLIPLDTHVARIARHLRLTSRAALGWRTAEEVTANLRRLDPADPVKYDFALCHYGMSGACPVKPIAENCRRCALASVCRVGTRNARREVRTPSAERR